MPKDEKIRVWSEFLPFDDLVKPDVVGLLAEYRVGLNVAVHHDRSWNDIEKLLQVYKERNVSAAFWVLLAKEDGYFPNERNIEKFRKRLFELMDGIASRGLAMPDIAVDLEPPLEEMELRRSKKKEDRRKARQRMKLNVDPARFQAASGEYRKLNEEIHQRGAKTLVAASPTIADDLRNGDVYTQDLLETPVTTVPWDRVSIMWYVSMLTGYSKGFIPYNMARYQLFRDAKTIVERLGPERASVSLGVTWTGVLGDEPYYQKPDDMRPDVEAAKAAGVRHIWIYNLEGILKAPRPADWLEMVLNAEPIHPQKSVLTALSTPARNAALWAVRLLYGCAT